MYAICITPEKGIRLEETPQPEKAAAGHLLIKMTASAINPGDKAFISRSSAPPAIPQPASPFKTKPGKTFPFASIREALAFESKNGEKTILDPFLP